MDLGTFLEIWQEHTIDGMTYPLPELWRLKVAIVPATESDWRFALKKAVNSSGSKYSRVKPEQVFNYALGVVWHRIGARMDSMEMDETPPYAVGPPQPLEGFQPMGWTEDGGVVFVRPLDKD